MSFGSLSAPAIEALNGGARVGGFAHNSGEGGISRYHRDHGGDLIWKIGSGLFGCRTKDGAFDPDTFAELAGLNNVKVIELKLSQGAKPGAGGILPACKLSDKIAEVRGVPKGEAVISPPHFENFSTPVGLLEFLQTLREVSGSKPVGRKLCVCQPHQFMAICKAMIATDITPDYIVVEGAEGALALRKLSLATRSACVCGMA